MMWSSHHCLPKKWRMTVTTIVNVRRFGSARTSCGNERAVSIRSANERRGGAIGSLYPIRHLVWAPALCHWRRLGYARYLSIGLPEGKECRVLIFPPQDNPTPPRRSPDPNARPRVRPCGGAGLSGARTGLFVKKNTCPP